jgi:hypothetical protein
VSAWRPLVAGRRSVLAEGFEPRLGFSRIEPGSGSNRSKPIDLRHLVAPTTDPRPYRHPVGNDLGLWAIEASRSLQAVDTVSTREALETVCFAVAEGLTEVIRTLVNQGRLEKLEELVDKVNEIRGHEGLQQRREYIGEVVEAARWAKEYPGHLIVLDEKRLDPVTKKWVKVDVASREP